MESLLWPNVKERLPICLTEIIQKKQSAFFKGTDRCGQMPGKKTLSSGCRIYFRLVVEQVYRMSYQNRTALCAVFKYCPTRYGTKHLQREHSYLIGFNSLIDDSVWHLHSLRRIEDMCFSYYTYRFQLELPIQICWNITNSANYHATCGVDISHASGLYKCNHASTSLYHVASKSLSKVQKVY